MAAARSDRRLLPAEYRVGDESRQLHRWRSCIRRRLLQGLNRETDFLRGGGIAHVDFRDNPYGPRSGGQYYMRFDYNHDRFGRGFTFRRLTAEAQQLIPMFNRKRVIALRAKTQMSFENPGQRVPFYMQPSLGGSDDLRGFRPFRFYDNNSIVYNAEWRWEVTSGAEAALFSMQERCSRVRAC